MMSRKTGSFFPARKKAKNTQKMATRKRTGKEGLYFPGYDTLKGITKMIKLIPVTEDNWMDIASLTVKEHQRDYVAPAIGILARGYVYRDCNAKVYAFEEDGVVVGTALVREFTDEPLGYDLQQFMIDQQYQNKGYGSQALQLILDALRKEGRFDHVELCVKKADTEAIHLYEKHGFIDSGYVDEDLPDSLNMICYLAKKDS